MSTTKAVVFRELGLAVSHASCESPAALDNAIEHADRALQALHELRKEARPWLAERACRVEHIREPVERVLRKLKGEG